MTPRNERETAGTGSSVTKPPTSDLPDSLLNSAWFPQSPMSIQYITTTDTGRLSPSHHEASPSSNQAQKCQSTYSYPGQNWSTMQTEPVYRQLGASALQPQYQHVQSISSGPWELSAQRPQNQESTESVLQIPSASRLPVEIHLRSNKPKPSNEPSLRANLDHCLPIIPFQLKDGDAITLCETTLRHSRSKSPALNRGRWSDIQREDLEIGEDRRVAESSIEAAERATRTPSSVWSGCTTTKTGEPLTSSASSIRTEESVSTRAEKLQAGYGQATGYPKTPPDACGTLDPRNAAEEAVVNSSPQGEEPTRRWTPINKPSRGSVNTRTATREEPELQETSSAEGMRRQRRRRRQQRIPGVTWAALTDELERHDAAQRREARRRVRAQKSVETKGKKPGTRRGERMPHSAAPPGPTREELADVEVLQVVSPLR
ncbi:hypothetical protein BX600DRAFT_508991 [Xylariales sp. PMI_506]|nr:hypothetical protein BX600DRAFT_508991 [Xylariales sp. PMI_506]